MPLSSVPHSPLPAQPARWRVRGLLVTSVLLVMGLLVIGMTGRSDLPATTARGFHQHGPAQESERRCFTVDDDTEYCIEGRIKEYWEANNGEVVFGLPMTPQRQETIQGQLREVQWFQRHRLELHPENERPYDVLLGFMGFDVLNQQKVSFPRVLENQGAPDQNCRFFRLNDAAESEAAGYYVCNEFRAFWETHGVHLDTNDTAFTDIESEHLFGLPMSPELVEILSDGQAHQVQWFQRARFELHDGQVLLGFLANELRSGGIQLKE